MSNYYKENLFSYLQGMEFRHFCWAVMLEHNSGRSTGKPNAEANSMVTRLNWLISLKQTAKWEIQSTKGLHQKAELRQTAQRSQARRREVLWFKVKIRIDWGWQVDCYQRRKKEKAQKQNFIKNLRSILSSDHGLYTEVPAKSVWFIFGM